MSGVHVIRMHCTAANSADHGVSPWSTESYTVWYLSLNFNVAAIYDFSYSLSLNYHVNCQEHRFFLHNVYCIHFCSSVPTTPPPPALQPLSSPLWDPEQANRPSHLGHSSTPLHILIDKANGSPIQSTWNYKFNALVVKGAQHRRNLMDSYKLRPVYWFYILTCSVIL